MIQQFSSWAYIWTNYNSKRYMHPYGHCSTIHNSQDMCNQPKCPLTDEWIKNMWYTHTREYYSATKKNEIMPFVATWMQPEVIMLKELSQKEDKCHMISLICGI